MVQKNNLGKFNFQDLDDILVGAHFYACGGGGAMANGRQLLEEIKKQLIIKGLDYVTYINPMDVPDDEWLPVVAAMGSPQKFLKYGYSTSPLSAFIALQNLMKKRLNNPDFTFCSVTPVECGVVAYMMSFLVGVNLGIPVVNGDGGGRAFPSLEMATFANPNVKADIQVSPCVLTSEQTVIEGGVSMTLDCPSAITIDQLTRSLISIGVGFEERASFSGFAMTGSQLKQPNALVHQTLISARDLGRNIRESSNPVKTIQSLLEADLICEGQITRVESSTHAGYDWLDVYITDAQQQEYIVVVKNENMMVWSKQADTPLVLAPDLICYIQPNGTVLSNTEIELHFQQSSKSLPIALFSLRAPKEIDNPWFHTQFAKVFESYGYNGAYHPPIDLVKKIA